MVDQDLIAKCKQAGKEDNRDDLTCTPSISERLNGLLSHFQAVGESAPYIKAWTFGWLSEQLRETV